MWSFAWLLRASSVVLEILLICTNLHLSCVSEKAYFRSCYIPSGTVRLCAFFIPGLIVISANAILFFFIGREIHETLATAPKTDKRERRKELRVYLSIFISIGLTWVFGYLIYLIPERIPQTVRTLSRCSGTDVFLVQIFLVLFSLTTPLQGFLIFAAYCVNAKVASKWAGLFGACIPCCKRWEELASSSTSSRF